MQINYADACDQISILIGIPLNWWLFHKVNEGTYIQIIHCLSSEFPSPDLPLPCITGIYKNAVTVTNIRFLWTPCRRAAAMQELLGIIHPYTINRRLVLFSVTGVLESNPAVIGQVTTHINTHGIILN